MISAGAETAGRLAAIHKAAFDRPWDVTTFTGLLSSPGVFAVTDQGLQGLILIRVAADESEVLTLAVIPPARRQGLARRLLEYGAATAASRGAANLFLEVATDNEAALALYRAAEFETIARRAGYYPRSAGPAADALVLKRPLGPPA